MKKEKCKLLLLILILVFAGTSCGFESGEGEGIEEEEATLGAETELTELPEPKERKAEAEEEPQDPLERMETTYKSDLQWLDDLFQMGYEDMYHAFGEYRINDYSGFPAYEYEDKLIYIDDHLDIVVALRLKGNRFEPLPGASKEEIFEIMGEKAVGSEGPDSQVASVSYRVQSYDFLFTQNSEDTSFDLLIKPKVYPTEGNRKKDPVAGKTVGNEGLQQKLKGFYNSGYSDVAFAEIKDFTGDGSLELLTIEGNYEIQNNMDFQVALYSYDTRRESRRDEK